VSGAEAEAAVQLLAVLLPLRHHAPHIKSCLVQVSFAV
jgi:hypothetical protein